MSVLAFENFKAFFKPNAFPASTGRRGGPPCSLLRLLVLRGNAKKLTAFRVRTGRFVAL